MEQMRMVEVKVKYRNDTMLFADGEEAVQFIFKQAAEQNYGLFRKYEINGVMHFDCGPNTYLMRHEDVPEKHRMKK